MYQQKGVPPIEDGAHLFLWHGADGVVKRPLKGRKPFSPTKRKGLHTLFIVYEMTMQGLHGLFGVYDVIMQGLHSLFNVSSM